MESLKYSSSQYSSCVQPGGNTLLLIPTPGQGRSWQQMHHPSSASHACYVICQDPGGLMHPLATCACAWPTASPKPGPTMAGPIPPSSASSHHRVSDDDRGSCRGHHHGIMQTREWLGDGWMLYCCGLHDEVVVALNLNVCLYLNARVVQASARSVRVLMNARKIGAR